MAEMRKIHRMGAGAMAGLMALCIAGGGLAEWKEQTKSGKVIRREWVDENGEAALAPEGYAAVTLEYHGTTVTETYYDLEGNPAQAIGGYYGQELTYGNRHRLEEQVFLDENGKKTNSIAGYARMKIIYMSSGSVSQASYYDAENNLIIVPSLGYAQVKNDYRGTTLTKTTYMDENKNLIDSPMGYAILLQSVNQKNRVTGISFQHADGSAAVSPEGWATMKRELDKNNREISVKYYDLTGRLMDRGLGYAYETNKWENDRSVVISRYDTQDQQISMGEGYTSLRREMNKSGQVIRETCLDAGGAATDNAEGFSQRAYKYEEDRISAVEYYNSSGALVKTK